MEETEQPVSQTPPVADGTAVIKAEFVVSVVKKDETGDPPTKKAKLEGGAVKKKGQFKNRYNHNKKHIVQQGSTICGTLLDVPEDAEQAPECSNKGCKMMHDVAKFLQDKPPDLGEECVVFKTKGHCPRGLSCRFGSSHLTLEGRNKVCKEVRESFEKAGLKTLNAIPMATQISLRKKKYNFAKSFTVLKRLPNCKIYDEAGQSEEKGEKEEEKEEEKEGEMKEEKEEEKEEKKVGPCADEDLVKLHLTEKRRIDWRGKLYLSPLTTLGNLPFRRVCKQFGADVTCGEMAMATSVLQTLPYELALLRRHSSEDLFGVQLCGNNPYNMTKCAQLLEESLELDFIDVNLGCPIDKVYQKGGGSGLLRRERVLENVVRSMAAVTNLPLTVKTRTGVYAGKNIAHRLMPLFCSAGVSMVTVHGRSREQRYTKTPDWDYIEECARVADPMPVFGNGDVLSYHDHHAAMSQHPHVAGVMIGRGALYKPWLFTEIKEQRDWDISASERLDILRRFVAHGLEHWGSDGKGVELTRKFLLEWLSFLHRYIPVGLLERPPQRINQRPPRYLGRSDLETLMASPSCADWVRISEMLLGPVPTDFQFLPKHRASAWAE